MGSIYVLSVCTFLDHDIRYILHDIRYYIHDIFYNRIDQVMCNIIRWAQYSYQYLSSCPEKSVVLPFQPSEFWKDARLSVLPMALKSHWAIWSTASRFLSAVLVFSCRVRYPDVSCMLLRIRQDLSAHTFAWLRIDIRASKHWNTLSTKFGTYVHVNLSQLSICTEDDEILLVLQTG